jgi:hypothetical protein
MRRNKNIPQLRFNFWTQKALFYYADPGGLTTAILESKLSETELRAKMGHGYDTIAELLEGKGIGIYSASFVESALTRDTEPTPQVHGYPPQVSNTILDALEVNSDLKHFFTNVKCDVGRMLREMSSSDRRDGEGLHLHSAFTCLEDIQKESAKPLGERDHKKVVSCWKRINEVTEKFDLFARYIGNTKIKKQLVDFLNGSR